MQMVSSMRHKKTENFGCFGKYAFVNRYPCISDRIGADPTDCQPSDEQQVYDNLYHFFQIMAPPSDYTQKKLCIMPYSGLHFMLFSLWYSNCQPLLFYFVVDHFSILVILNDDTQNNHYCTIKRKKNTFCVMCILNNFSAKDVNAFVGFHNLSKKTFFCMNLGLVIKTQVW